MILRILANGQQKLVSWSNIRAQGMDVPPGDDLAFLPSDGWKGSLWNSLEYTGTLSYETKTQKGDFWVITLTEYLEGNVFSLLWVYF